MEWLADRFVEERDQVGGSGPGQRVPEALRVLAVRYARWAMEDEGESLSGAARRLSVGAVTLRRWLESARDSVPAMREVVVRDLPAAKGEPPSPCLSLVTPEGFRVEGLSPAEVVELVRALQT